MTKPGNIIREARAASREGREMHPHRYPDSTAAPSPSSDIESVQVPMGQGVTQTAYYVGNRFFFELAKAQHFARTGRLPKAPKAKRTKSTVRPLDTDATGNHVKALVVHSPYAQEIASGEKRIEYRCWSCRYRGWLAIVAARRRDSGADAGRVVCLVHLDDCIEAGPKDYEWHLSRPRPIAERIEIPGRLGLFEVSHLLPASVLAMAK
jgi:hypothetical protein